MNIPLNGPKPQWREIEQKKSVNKKKKNLHSNLVIKSNLWLKNKSLFQFKYNSNNKYTNGGENKIMIIEHYQA